MLQRAQETVKRFSIPLVSFLIGLVVITQMRDFTEGFLFLAASVGQFVMYVFVSRTRQRGSFFWHVIASIGSNGMWYAVMSILDKADAYWLLIVPYLAGIIAGRTAGVQLAQYVEKRWNLQADATRDSRLEPGKRLEYLTREPMFWVLLLGLIGYILYAQVGFGAEMRTALYVVVGLGLLQNFSYALTSRAAQRGNNWYIAITGVMSGTIFFISATYLFSKDMPAALAVPYILSTSLGSATGAFFSMILEWVMKLRPDAHLEKAKSAAEEQKRKKERSKIPYVVLLGLAVAWIFVQVPLFKALGWPIAELQFPVVHVAFDLPRVAVMIAASLVFLLDSALHVVASRAGNRDHVGYHVAALFPKGTADFFKISYLSLNSHIPDIVPIAVVASCLGSLFGKSVSEAAERFLQARMDIPTQEAKTKTA